VADRSARTISFDRLPQEMRLLRQPYIDPA